MASLINEIYRLHPELKQDHTKLTMVAVNAADDEVIKSVQQVIDETTMNVILLGDEKEIESVLENYSLDPSRYSIESVSSDEESAFKAVELVRQGKADIILKGHIGTGTLLKQVVNKETGIRDKDVLTHVAVLYVPTLKSLVAISDGGLVLEPDEKSGKVVIENAVKVMKHLLNKPLKVALLSAAEQVIPKLASSVIEEQLAKELTIENTIIEGPLSIDISLVPDIAKEKDYRGEIQGDADILYAPDISTGNILSKALILFGGAQMAGVIMGAKVPIVVTSRSSSADEKFASVLLSQIMMKGDSQ
ncbi:phosphate acetyl/butyryl transferase [Dolosicoccus paucivorans]|uniref:Phosphate acetyl/butyryl transferase n=1 Tax=Dolosicoccus paucivorans TaxID=84521 RepID=A0A2N6SLK5_9LACT|nr:phosphate acyltransferase [Dolosicoccus paucivorans]PMC57933.1 phosphate acetyl/butyryl transferase [Dolosicoccus paucivorans]